MSEGFYGLLILPFEFDDPLETPESNAKTGGKTSIPTENLEKNRTRVRKVTRSDGESASSEPECHGSRT